MPPQCCSTFKFFTVFTYIKCWDFCVSLSSSCTFASLNASDNLSYCLCCSCKYNEIYAVGDFLVSFVSFLIYIMKHKKSLNYFYFIIQKKSCRTEKKALWNYLPRMLKIKCKKCNFFSNTFVEKTKNGHF